MKSTSGIATALLGIVAVFTTNVAVSQGRWSRPAASLVRPWVTARRRG